MSSVILRIRLAVTDTVSGASLIEMIGNNLHLAWKVAIPVGGNERNYDNEHGTSHHQHVLAYSEQEAILLAVQGNWMFYQGCFLIL